MLWARDMPRIAAPLLASLLLAGCASSGDEYPSLAIRDAERPGNERVEGSFASDAPAPSPEPTPAASADLLQRLAQLRGQAQSAHRDFRQAAPSATRLARAAGATGSDSWASAQVALADLDSIRSQAAIALAELDILYIDAALDNALRPEIAQARADVVALVAEEDRTLEELRARVR